LVKWSSKPTDPIKQRLKKNLKISGHQQRWPRPLPGTILIPPALLVVADFRVHEEIDSQLQLMQELEQILKAYATFESEVRFFSSEIAGRFVAKRFTAGRP